MADNAVTAPRIYEDIAYVGCMDKNLYFINASNGKLVRKFKTNDMVTTSPACKDGILYFGSWDCNLYAITTQGDLKWKFTTSNPIPSAVSIDPSVFESKQPKFVWESMGSTPPELYRMQRQHEDEREGPVYGSKDIAYKKKDSYLSNKRTYR